MMEINLREIVLGLSDALDLVGFDDLYHGKRVAFMAVECGRILNHDPGFLSTLLEAGLLHDCGVSSTKTHASLVNEFQWDKAQDHCLIGEYLLKKCLVFQDLAPIVRHHHTDWADLPQNLDKKTALAANLIHLADRVDVLATKFTQESILYSKDVIGERILGLSGTAFAPEFVDAFTQLAFKDYFWLSLQPNHILHYLRTIDLKPGKTWIDYQTLVDIAAIFAEIVDAKSPFTAEHSHGVAHLARFIGSLLGLAPDTLLKLQAAGFLHDLGKLYVPDGILDKPGPLTGQERAIIKRHSFESYQILNKISGLEDIAQWAGYHHETLSGLGYPFKLHEAKLSLEARILAVADVFQALAQKRPYREALPADKIIAMLTEMAQNQALDPNLVAICQEHLHECFAQATGQGP